MADANSTQRPDLLNFPPVWTNEQLKEIEANYEKTWGRFRRITQATLSRSGDQLLEGFGKVEDAMTVVLDMVDEIKTYQDHLKSGIELTEAAIARLLCVAKHVTESSQSKDGAA